MKTKGLHIRISERRLNKIRTYAANKEKTITQIIEDYIDRLPTSETGNSVRLSAHGEASATPLPLNPTD